MSSSYKKIDNNYLNSDDLEKSSFIKQHQQQMTNKPASKKTNYGSLHTPALATQTATAFLVNHRHRIQPGETLQGISLKYSVPIDVIKRSNRLWSNDIAFVKDFLLVPVDREKLRSLNIDYDETANSLTSSASSSSQIVNLNDINLATSNSPNTPQTNNHNESSLDANSPSKEEYKSYLNKFDSFINESKLKLKHLETNSNLTVSDYLRTNKSIFSNSTENFNGTSNANSELDNDEDIFDINGGRQSNASTSSKTKKSHSASNRTLNTSSMSSGYESSKLSASDTNQTINQLNGNLSSNSSSASNLNTLSNENVSCDSPELLIKTSSKRASTSGNNITKNFYGSSHNLKSGSGLHSSSSRARLAQENLQRLEREKDDLYEL